MKRSTIIAAATMLCGSVALVGCTGAAPTESAAPTAAVTDADTCVAFGDVLTVQFNADLGLRDGRMHEQEHGGWLALATRVLDRIPTRGDGAVSEAVATLKAVAPPIALPASGVAGIGTEAWYAAYGELSRACEAAGTELGVMAFTGG